MTRRPLTLSRRLVTASRWPLGMLKTSWDYLWRTTPMRRSEEPGSARDDLPPPLPVATDMTDLRRLEDGFGPLLHRHYVICVKDAERTAEEVIGAFAAKPNRGTPTALASFVKLRGEEGVLRVGDEFTVRLPGPWDGPVRAVEVQPATFCLVTLEGHLEAGRIRFSARDLAPGRLELRIESWARGGDRLSNLLYDHLRVNKEVQLHMWVSVLERLTRLSGGTRDGPVSVRTRRVAPDELVEVDAPDGRSARADERGAA